MGHRIAAVLMLGMAGACASNPAAVEIEQKQQVVDDTRQEIEIGRLMAAKLAGRFGLDDDNAEQVKYLSLLGQSLARKVGRPELKFYFGILKANEVNAFACPGGYIFVTRPLLNQVRSEDELAVVLGHEIAHVNQRHLYDKIKPAKQIDASGVVARAFSRGMGDIGQAMTQSVSQGLATLLDKGLDAKFEKEADEAGILFVASLGYQPQSLKAFLSRTTNAHHEFPKTHPPANERMNWLSEVVKKNGLEGMSVANDAASQERARRFSKAFPKNKTL